MEEGVLKDEVCNRNGCQGIIAEHDTDSSCSCHINPPCSHCTTDRTYCPVCDYDGRQEQIESDLAQAQAFAKANPNYQPPKVRTLRDLSHSKIDWISEQHTHFSMRKIGVFPPGTTRKEVYEKVKGTFGGRFSVFDEQLCRFNFIAYTD